MFTYDMPEDIRNKYQYFTEANMQKLREAGYTNDFYSLEEGVVDYVRNYLSKRKNLLILEKDIMTVLINEKLTEQEVDALLEKIEPSAKLFDAKNILIR
ncbi:MAG: hypothetical protein WKG06_37475 [Segetibacter sp.]